MPKFSWRALHSIVIGVVGLVAPQVAAAEQAIVGAFTGPDKLRKTREAILQSLGAAEAISDKDLLNDQDVQQAVDGVINSIVALQNIVADLKAKKAAAAEAAEATDVQGNPITGP